MSRSVQQHFSENILLYFHLLADTLLLSLDMKHLIGTNATLNDVRAQAKKEGIEPLRVAGARKVMSGLTTLEEVLRVVPLS